MTVTYRHVSAEDVDPGSGRSRGGESARRDRGARGGSPGGGRGPTVPPRGSGPSGPRPAPPGPDPVIPPTAARRCADCGTDFDVALRSDVMIVKARGGTCAACAPAAETHAEPSAVERAVRVWWAGSSAGDAHWQAVQEATNGRGAQPTRSLRIEPDPPADGPAPADVNWSVALAPYAQNVLGDADLRVVARAWQPVHCRILDGLATLLEAFWNEIVAEAGGASRLVVRLTGLPPLVAALIPELTFRGLREAQYSAKSMTELIRLLRSTGPVFCALTGHVTACTEVRHRLGGVPELPSPDALESLCARPVLLALKASSGLPTLSELLGPEPVRPPAPTPVAETVAAAGVGGGLLGTRQVLDDLGEAPSAPSTFGTA